MDKALPDAAVPAWEAYLEMDHSKRAHFEYLDALEKQERDGGYRTLEQTSKLDNLLTEHDRNVREFTRRVRALEVEDIAAHQKLLERITLWNTNPTSGEG